MNLYNVDLIDHKITRYTLLAEDEESAKDIIENLSPEELDKIESEVVFSEWGTSNIRKV